MKKLYKIEMLRNNKPCFIIAFNANEAEKLLKDMFRLWEYSEPVVTSIHIVAEGDQYSELPMLLLK